MPPMEILRDCFWEEAPAVGSSILSPTPSVHSPPLIGMKMQL